MKKYPARWIGLVMAAVGLATAFGLFALTPEKTVAIEAFLLAVLPIVQALATERRVYSPETHQKEIQRANNMGQGGYSWYPAQSDEEE